MFCSRTVRLTLPYRAKEGGQIKSTFRQLEHSNLKDAIIKSINSINTNFINLYNKCYNNIIN